MTVFNDTMQQYAGAIGADQRQKELVNMFMKPAPFMSTIPIITSSLPLSNRYEEVTKVEGAEYKEIDAPFKEMDVHTEIRDETLGILGGKMAIGEDRALLLAASTSDSKTAAERYFAKRSPIIINDAGKKTEKHLIYNILLKRNLMWNATADSSEKTAFDAGGTSNKNYTIFAIRQEKEMNCGLVSPVGKNKNEIMFMDWLNGGLRHVIADGTDKNKVGYEATWKSFFGYQVAVPQYIGAIYNIDPSSSSTSVTVSLMAEMLDSIEADPSDTVIVMSRGLKSKLLGMKWDKVTLSNSDSDLNTGFDKFDGIPIIGTSNMLKGTESNVSVP